MPDSLTLFDCSTNALSSLPVLPNSLITIDCHLNHIVSLPSLPPTLIELDCRGNDLISLPPLPNSLIELDCEYNELSYLPSLPASLSELRCENNHLISLPVLNNSLHILRCDNNLLTTLPPIPNNLNILYCTHNQLHSLPALPKIMDNLEINDNNITCLINLPNLFGFPNFSIIANNPFTCVPNQTNYTGNLPLCMYNDPISNPNNCPGVNITGRVYDDLNGNCFYDITDSNSRNIPVKLFDAQNNFHALSYTLNGLYSFNVLLPDTYFVKIDTLNYPFTIDCGQPYVQSVYLGSANQTIQNVNFLVDCNAPIDAWIQFLTPLGLVFPGQIHNLRTMVSNNSNLYNLQCDTSIIGGTITININGPATFIAPIPGSLTPVVSGNTFTYTVGDFNTLSSNSLGLQFLTDTTAQAGDLICVSVEIAPIPIDADTINNEYNFCYLVVNSNDPNMKEVYPVNVLPGYDDWFTYTIHFQNTGTAPAFNIRLSDTLDAQLDLSSFEMLGYSHPAVVSLNGNILTVRFNNIMLPDSTSDYEGSMGYFQYRIKPLSNLPLGTQVENTAYIYFDYNSPIVTNTTQNNFVWTGQKEVSGKQFLALYPNPGTGIFYFKDSRGVQSVEVYNLLGEKLLQLGAVNQINLQDQPKGIYLVRVNGTQMARVVKE